MANNTEKVTFALELVVAMATSDEYPHIQVIKHSSSLEENAVFLLLARHVLLDLGHFRHKITNHCSQRRLPIHCIKYKLTICRKINKNKYVYASPSWYEAYM